MPGEKGGVNEGLDEGAGRGEVSAEADLETKLIRGVFSPTNELLSAPNVFSELISASSFGPCGVIFPLLLKRRGGGLVALVM